MSFETNVTNLATRVATECKSIRTMLNGNAGDLSALTTSAKSNLVAALNELNAELDALSAGAAGIDDATTATTSTWSSQKTADEILEAATGVKDDILGGAGAAYDTLSELKALLDASDSADDTALSAINTALTHRVRTDINNQALDATMRLNARTNIDVYSKGEIGDVTTNFVTTFEAGLV